MTTETFGDERDYEDGGLHISGMRPPRSESSDAGDYTDEFIATADEVLTPNTSWVDPVSVGNEIRRLSGKKAQFWNATRHGQNVTFHEGVAHMSRTGVLGSWTPRGGEVPKPVSAFSNSLIEVDALSLGQLLSRCKDNSSVVWMNGFHAIHFHFGIAILDTEERLHCWLPYA